MFPITILPLELQEIDPALQLRYVQDLSIAKDLLLLVHPSPHAAVEGIAESLDPRGLVHHTDAIASGVGVKGELIFGGAMPLEGTRPCPLSDISPVRSNDMGGFPIPHMDIPERM